MPAPMLETERLILRPFSEDDLHAYTELLQREEVRRSLHLPDDIGREQAHQQMCLWLGQWELRGTGQWALEEKSTGRFVGRAGTHYPERADWPGIEVGWTIHPEHWGRGFATEAGARSVQYRFDELPGDDVFSVILPENARSRSVARHLGFTLFEERTLSHFPAMAHGIWRLTRAGWAASRCR